MKKKIPTLKINLYATFQSCTNSCRSAWLELFFEAIIDHLYIHGLEKSLPNAKYNNSRLQWRWQTTASTAILPEILKCKEFVNADKIAARQSPFNVASVSFEAGRIMLARIHYFNDGKGRFCF